MSDTGTPGRDLDVDRVLHGLAGLLHWDSVSKDYVRLRIGLFQAQTATLRDLAQLPAEPPSEVTHGQSLLLRREDIRFDLALAARLLDALAEVLQRHGRPALQLARLRSAVSNRRPLLDDLTRGVVLGTDEEYLASLARRLDAAPELLLFLGRLLAAPFVTHAAGRVPEEVVAASVSDGNCPLCGSTPGLASLRPDDGARVLHCSLCGHSWTFGRLECPFCIGRQGDRHIFRPAPRGYPGRKMSQPPPCERLPPDQSAPTRLEVAGEDARWIEACDQCRHYLKVVDRRRLAQGEDFIPLVEEVAGLYLDLVAEREGYLPKPPYAAVG